MNLRFRRSKTTYLIDENIKISDIDMGKLRGCVIINSTDIFKKGAPDELLTDHAKAMGYIIVTKDIRMALRSLKDGVGVIFISDDSKTIEFLTVSKHKIGEFAEIHSYLSDRFNYG